jgi:hypothetical protein
MTVPSPMEARVVYAYSLEPSIPIAISPRSCHLGIERFEPDSPIDPTASNCFNGASARSVADEVAGRRLPRRGHVPRFRGGSVARRLRAAG